LHTLKTNTKVVRDNTIKPEDLFPTYSDQFWTKSSNSLERSKLCTGMVLHDGKQITEI